jgi:hypothetical protein
VRRVLLWLLSIATGNASGKLSDFITTNRTLWNNFSNHCSHYNMYSTWWHNKGLTCHNSLPTTTSIQLTSWSSCMYLLLDFIFFLMIYQSFLLTICFMSFIFSIIRLVTMEDQVHIGTSSLREIVAATPTNQATTTTCELYGDDVNCVMWCDHIV